MGELPTPRRIVIVGSSGAGKSTLARRLAECGYAHLELDALAHQPHWNTLPDAEMRFAIGTFLGRHDRWVVDGNYTRFRKDIWSQADAIVWLDLKRSMVMSRLFKRSVSRLLRREVLWNGNRERWRDVFSLDPERSVLRWAWLHFDEYRVEYSKAMSRGPWDHIGWVRLQTTKEVTDFALAISRCRRGESTNMVPSEA